MRSHTLPLLHWEPAVVAGMVIDASSYLRAHSRSPSPDPPLAVDADRGPSTCLQEELADSVSLPPGVCPTAPRATSQLNLSVVLSFEPLPCDGISLVSLSLPTPRLLHADHVGRRGERQASEACRARSQLGERRVSPRSAHGGTGESRKRDFDARLSPRGAHRMHAYHPAARTDWAGRYRETVSRCSFPGSTRPRSQPCY